MSWKRRELKASSSVSGTLSWTQLEKHLKAWCLMAVGESLCSRSDWSKGSTTERVRERKKNQCNQIKSNKIKSSFNWMRALCLMGMGVSLCSGSDRRSSTMEGEKKSGKSTQSGPSVSWVWWVAVLWQCLKERQHKEKGPKLSQTNSNQLNSLPASRVMLVSDPLYARSEAGAAPGREAHQLQSTLIISSRAGCLT